LRSESGDELSAVVIRGRRGQVSQRLTRRKYPQAAASTRLDLMSGSG
jgi:hypothetical protein